MPASAACGSSGGSAADLHNTFAAPAATEAGSPTPTVPASDVAASPAEQTPIEPAVTSSTPANGISWACPSGQETSAAIGAEVSSYSETDVSPARIGAECDYWDPLTQATVIRLVFWGGSDPIAPDGPPKGTINETKAVGVPAYYGSDAGSLVRLNVFPIANEGFVVLGPSLKAGQLVSMASQILTDSHVDRLTFGPAGPCSGGWLTAWCAGISG
ncbi:MAG TPA: hypothetical protein VF375_08685 [Candidatus Limnocylindrales bacterium]